MLVLIAALCVVRVSDHHGLRTEPTAPEDTFLIAWLGVFNAQGKLQRSVTGGWQIRCAHSSGRVAPHAWTETRCACEPHKRMVDTIERQSILLYECEFTDGMRLNAITKGQVVSALKAFPERMKSLPKSWQPKEEVSLQDKCKKKGKARKR